MYVLTRVNTGFNLKKRLADDTVLGTKKFDRVNVFFFFLGQLRSCPNTSKPKVPPPIYSHYGSRSILYSIKTIPGRLNATRENAPLLNAMWQKKKKKEKNLAVNVLQKTTR